MSGLWLLLVLGVWGGLTWLLWRAGRGLGGAKAAHRPVWLSVAVLGWVIWLSVSFWFAGGRKIYYDAQINRMCRVDGGIKVYVAVRLPAERFDAWGNVRIPSKQDAKSSDEYYFERDTTYLRTGNPEMWRGHHRIIRRSDGKVLGESIWYSRRGGDLPGPWHESSFGCPPIAKDQPQLEPSVFIKGDN